MFGALHIIVALLIALSADPGSSWDGSAIGLSAKFLASTVLVAIVAKLVGAFSPGPPRVAAARTESWVALLSLILHIYMVQDGDLAGALVHEVGISGDALGFALLVPVLLWSALGWWEAASRMRRDEDPSISRAGVVKGRFFVSLLNIAPYGVLISILAALRAISPDLEVLLAHFWWAQIGAVFFAVFVSASIVPLVFRVLLPVQRFPDGPLRDRLEDVARRCGVKVDAIWLWRTGSLRLPNAFFTGLVWPFRSVFFTDTLLERLTVEEVEAVMAHELGHARHRHLWILMAFLITLPLMMTGLVLLLEWSDAAEFAPWLDTAVSATLISNVLPLLLIVVWLWLGFGVLSRRLERQADGFAADHVGTDAMCSALYRLGRNHPKGMLRDGWRHFSIARRIKELMVRERRHDEPMAAALVAKWDGERTLVLRTLAVIGVGVAAALTPVALAEMKHVPVDLPLIRVETAWTTGRPPAEWKAQADRFVSAILDVAKRGDGPIDDSLIAEGIIVIAASGGGLREVESFIEALPIDLETAAIWRSLSSAPVDLLGRQRTDRPSLFKLSAGMVRAYRRALIRDDVQSF